MTLTTIAYRKRNTHKLFLDSTSIHGLQQTGRNHIFGLRAVIFWCCAFLASISLMYVQITNLTTYMMSYPKVVKYELSGGDLTFPSVTVCNMGLVRKSALDKIPTFMAMESALKAVGTNVAAQSGTLLNGWIYNSNNNIIITNNPQPFLCLQCQQHCDHVDPFCFYNPWTIHNFSDGYGTCVANGGYLPNIELTTSVTYRNIVISYLNQTLNTWFWTDVVNNNGNFYVVYIGPPVQYYNTSPSTPSTIVCICHCPSVQIPLNGVISNNSTDLGAFVQFSCDVSFRLIGSNAMTCQYNSGNGVDWNSSVPLCLLDCAAIVSQMFTVTYQNKINNINTSSFSVAIFTCPTGFTLYGRNSSITNSFHYNGSWDILASDYPLCSDAPFPSVNESQFLSFAGNNSNTINAATTFTSLLPYLLSSLSDAQMVAIGFNETQIVVRCTFGQKDCQKLDIVAQRDAQNGMCYTFNHKNKPQLYAVDRSGQNYGLKLLLFSLQDEYLPIIVSGGLKVFIGDQNDPIFFGQNGFMVTPGLTYSIGLRKVQLKEMEVKLNVPEGLCVETASEVQYYNFNVNTSYFQEACISSFVQSQIVNKCSCGAPTLPVNDSFTPICGVVQHNCVQQVYEDNDHLVDMAKTFCPQSCSSTYYQRTPTTWTSRVNEPLARELSVSDAAYLKNTVDISIYFEDLTAVTLQEKLSYTVVNLLSDLGASMGVLVGMSVVSWVEFIYAMAELVVFWVKKMKKSDGN